MEVVEDLTHLILLEQLVALVVVVTLVKIQAIMVLMEPQAQVEEVVVQQVMDLKVVLVVLVS